MVAIAACDLRFESLPTLYWVRHVARSFYLLSRHDGGAEEEPARSFSEVQRFEEAARKPQCSRRHHLKNFDGQKSIAENWCSRCSFAAEIVILLGSGAALMARQWKRTRAWECIHVCCVRAPGAGLSNGSATPHQTPMWSRTIGGLILSNNDGRNISGVQARLAAYGRSRSGVSPPAQRLLDHRTHEFLREPAEARVWVLASPSRRVPDYLRPSLVPAVMLGHNVSGNLTNTVCDGGLCHIPHLSLTDERPWSITDYRPRENVEQVQQRCKKNGEILLSSVSMRRTLTCRIGSASWPFQCVLFVRARTYAFLQILSSATRQKNQCSHSCLTMTKTGTIRLETQTFSPSIRFLKSSKLSEIHLYTNTKLQ